MTFRITGLDPTPFQHLYGLSDDVLRQQGVHRCAVTEKPGFPDRVELRDLEPGESALLLNHTHLPADTPYRASHAIFIREGAVAPAQIEGEVPDVLRCRLLSIRAYASDHMMVDADVVEGVDAEALINRFLQNEQVASLHVHAARRGCFLARVDRA